MCSPGKEKRKGDEGEKPGKDGEGKANKLNKEGEWGKSRKGKNKRRGNSELEPNFDFRFGG